MFNKLKSLGRRIAKSLSGQPRAFAAALRSALSHGRPGAWASDHRAETLNVTGWNYVGIKAIGIQVMQAEVSAYVDSDADSAKMRRKTIRKSFGSYRRFKAMYGDESDTSKELDANHALVKLLKRPNPHQNGASFRYEQIQQLEATGTCLIWNVPNGFGLTVERYVVATALATPVWPTANMPRGGWMISPGAARYFAPLDDDQGFVDSGVAGYILAVGATIPAEQMQVIRWPHPLYRDDGYSPLAAGSLWSDTAKQIDETRWSQMRNQADPSLAISPGPETDPSPEELDAAAKILSEKYCGSENAKKVMLVPAGSTVTTLSATPKEMGYDVGFEQMRDAVMGVHGTPPVAAGVGGAASYAAFYAQLKQFTELTVQPILSMLAESDTEILAPQFGDGLTVEYEAAAIDDPTVLETRLATDINAGNAVTVDEYRALRGMEPLGGKKGEAFVGAKPEPPKPVMGVKPSNGTADSENDADFQTTGQKGPPKVSAKAHRNGHRNRVEIYP